MMEMETGLFDLGTCGNVAFWERDQAPKNVFFLYLILS